MHKHLLLETLSGTVGKEVAVSFLQFVKVASKLPDIEQILESGEGELREEVDVLYALSSGLVSAYLKTPNEKRLENLLRYTLKMQSEFAVMVVQDLQRTGVDMQHSEAFKEWVEKFAYLLA
jgi:hypothetical protein